MKLARLSLMKCLGALRWDLRPILILMCLMMAQTGFAQERVNGNITDESGIPIAGAAVVEKGTTNGTVSDFDGNFEITTTAADAVLVISYLGFVAQEIAAQSGPLQVVLREDLQQLSEVVVIGY